LDSGAPLSSEPIREKSCAVDFSAHCYTVIKRQIPDCAKYGEQVLWRGVFPIMGKMMHPSLLALLKNSPPGDLLPYSLGN
jgi:hypothetical protein